MTTGYPRGSCRERERELENGGWGGKEKEWTDCVAEDLRQFGITGNWSTGAFDPRAWYNTVHEGSCRFMAAWVKEEEKASEHRAEEERSGRGGQG